MKTKLAIPCGFRHRAGFFSGEIDELGYPDYGVIFTCHDYPPKTDFQPELLNNAYIYFQNTAAGKQDSENLFEILGGYYWINPKYSTSRIKTPAAFGIAKEDERICRIENSLKTRLINTVFRSRKASKFANRHIFEKHGWTFIVKNQRNSIYPGPNNKLHLVALCPEIIDIQSEIYYQDAQKWSVLFHSITIDGEPDAFVWQWGDGNRPRTTSRKTIIHDFSVPSAGESRYIVTVTAKGPRICQNTKRTIVVTFAV